MSVALDEYRIVDVHKMNIDLVTPHARTSPVIEMCYFFPSTPLEIECIVYFFSTHRCPAALPLFAGNAGVHARNLVLRGRFVNGSQWGGSPRHPSVNPAAAELG